MKIIKESKRFRDGERDFKEEEKIKSIISRVKEKGDKALKEFTLKFDEVEISSFKVSEQEIKDVEEKVDKNFIIAIEKAKERIENFHRIQKAKFKDWRQEKDGILAGEIFKPLQKIGIYVPAGKAPLPSSLLMAGIPAQVAGVEKIVVTTPPQKDGNANPHILATANLLSIKEIYKIGGAQAIAALAYGTETIPKVDKIVGPGNIYVTLAKKLLYGEVGIDILAGPSEVTIIADDTADAEFVAYDLISQTEHGPHSPAILLSPSQKICKEVEEKIKVLLSTCDENIKKSWQENGGIYLVRDLEEAFTEVNKSAPEHLILAIKNPFNWLNKIKSAGAVLLGNYSPVTLGDYIAGPNHILPTSKTGRWDWPLGIKDFLKCINVVSANKSSLERLEPILKSLTDAEKLKNHFQAVKIRNKN
jgi:histidinol dehydrogenase